MTNRSFFFTIALLFCTTIARAQYNQVNDIPYRDAAQGYDHGAMPQPAYKILKDHIRRITAKMISALPAPTVKTERQAEYRFSWQKEYVRRDVRIDDGVLHLGTNNVSRAQPVAMNTRKSS